MTSRRGEKPLRKYACTEDIFNGRNTKAARRIPKDLWRIAARINDQFRIVFEFDRGEASNVVIADYH